MEQTILINKRVCYSCDSDKTYVDKRGSPTWYLNQPTNLVLCNSCYLAYIYNELPEYRRRKYFSRTCHACGFTTGIYAMIKGNQSGWCLNPPTSLTLCNSCYHKYILGPDYRIKQKESNGCDESRSKHALKTLQYAGKTIIYTFRQLTGYCSKCPNNIYDDSCKVTNMHHLIYIIIFPWFGREELCASCHAKEGWKNGQLGITKWNMMRK